MEPNLNAHEVVLLDLPVLEQELLGLIWRGGRIDHPAGEHDDFSNAVAGVIQLLLAVDTRLQIYACGPDEPDVWSPIDNDVRFGLR